MRAKNNGSRIARRNAALVQSVIEALDQRVLFSVLAPVVPSPFGAIDTTQPGTAGGITLVKSQDALGGTVTDLYVGGSVTTVGSEVDQLLLAFNPSPGAPLDVTGPIPSGITHQNIAGTDAVNDIDADSFSQQIFLVGSSQVGAANNTTVGSYQGYDLAGNATGGGRALSASSTAVPTTFNAVQIFPRKTVAFAAGTAAPPIGTAGAGTQFAVAEIGAGAGNFGDDVNFATTFNFGVNTTDAANAIGIQTSRVVVAGSSTQIANGAAITQIALAGLSFNGPSDQSFKNGDQKGLIRLNIPGSTDDTATALTIEADNSILIAGVENGSGTGANESAIFIHLLPDGSFDTTFGTGGILHAFSHFTPVGVGISSDGRITSVDKNSFSVARINPNGTVDTTYGTGGVKTETFNLNNVAGASATSVTATGMVIYHNLVGKDDILYATGNISDGVTQHIALLGEDLPATSGGDLQITKLALAPNARKSITFAKATGKVTIPVNVTVSGADQKYDVDFSLSTDTLVGNADDILIKSASFPAGSNGRTVFLTLPAKSVFTGSYAVVATIRPTGGKLESNAFNNSFINTAANNIISIKTKNFLKLTGFGISDGTATLIAGEPKFATLAIDNTGGAITAPVPVKFEFSASQNFSTKAFPSPFIEAIATGLVSGPNTVQVPIVTPASLIPGKQYFVRVTVNPKSAIGFIQEFNAHSPAGIFPAIEVNAPPSAPDYIVTSVVPLERNVAAGRTASARVTIKNVGTGDAPKSVALGLALELSSSNVPGSNVFMNGNTTADLAVSTVNAKLARGQSHTYTINYTFPSTFTSALESNAGKAFLVAEVNANPAASADELDKFPVHNRGYAKTPIVENFVNLQPTKIDSATSKIVTVEVTNFGNEAASGSARVILTAVDIGTDGTIIQNGLFNVDIPAGGSHTYKFLVNSSIAPLGKSRIAVQIESNGATSTDLATAPTSTNSVTLP